jgi:hypothetical protein
MKSGEKSERGNCFSGSGVTCGKLENFVRLKGFRRDELSVSGINLNTMTSREPDGWGD